MLVPTAKTRNGNAPHCLGFVISLPQCTWRPKTHISARWDPCVLGCDVSRRGDVSSSSSIDAAEPLELSERSGIDAVVEPGRWTWDHITSPLPVQKEYFFNLVTKKYRYISVQYRNEKCKPRSQFVCAKYSHLVIRGRALRYDDVTRAPWLTSKTVAELRITDPSWGKSTGDQ